MAYDYIRRVYGADPKPGQRIAVDGKRGTIIGSIGDPQYIKVRFDGEFGAANVHPTWRVDYAPVETP